MGLPPWSSEYSLQGTGFPLCALPLGAVSPLRSTWSLLQGTKSPSPGVASPPRSTRFLPPHSGLNLPSARHWSLMQDAELNLPSAKHMVPSAGHRVPIPGHSFRVTQGVSSQGAASLLLGTGSLSLGYRVPSPGRSFPSAGHRVPLPVRSVPCAGQRSLPGKTGSPPRSTGPLRPAHHSPPRAQSPL